MKYLFKISAILIFAIVAFCSCSSKKTNDAPIPMFVIGDSIEVQGMIEEYLDLIHDKNYELAFSKLYNIQGDVVNSISEEEQEDLMQQYYTFPVIKYHCESMDFIDERHVNITYVIEFFEKDPDSNIPNTYKITFAPQRLNAQWFICIKNESVFQ